MHGHTCIKTIFSDSRNKTLTVLKARINQPRHRPASLVLLIAAVRAATHNPMVNISSFENANRQLLLFNYQVQWFRWHYIHE